ncbi:hypothetical protein ACFQNE_01920 [Gordonia phosphorivorans]|uniref:Uncharacterized protein n=1 Tax=Gordonia phosphorivorans TaxID=1056982 RepID=A0ABV6H6L8_9ACTN
MTTAAQYIRVGGETVRTIRIGTELQSAIAALHAAQAHADELIRRRGGFLAITTVDGAGHPTTGRRAQAMATFAGLPGECLVAYSDSYDRVDCLESVDVDAVAVLAVNAMVQAIERLVAQLHFHPAELGRPRLRVLT